MMTYSKQHLDEAIEIINKIDINAIQSFVDHYFALGDIQIKYKKQDLEALMERMDITNDDRICKNEIRVFLKELEHCPPPIQLANHYQVTTEERRLYLLND